MKKRRLAIVSFVLLACLVMGIGYAALTANLTINTNIGISYDTSNYSVVFTVAEVSNTSTAAAANSTVATANDTAAMTIDVAKGILKKVGDTVVIVATITNKSTSYDAIIKTPTVGTNETLKDYVTVTCALNETDADATYKTLAPSGTTTVTVTVKMIALPVSDIDLTNITITIPTDADTVPAT